MDALEDLLFDGNLLEVDLDELKSVWKILLACEPRRSKKYPDLGELEAELESVREEKLKAKKKRRLENGEAGVDGGSAAKKRARDGKKKQPNTMVTKRKRKAEHLEDNETEDDDENVEEEEQDCSASPSCLRPLGDVSLNTFSS